METSRANRWRRWMVLWGWIGITGLGTRLPAQGPKDNVSPLIIAHRGASHQAPENTLAAFKLAWEEGADGIEGDFHVTRDGKIVCIHDEDTKRITGVEKRIVDCTLGELRELDYGLWKGEAYRDEPIPTFSEVLASIPAGKTFVVELKTGPEVILPLQAIWENEKRTDIRMLVISFHDETVRTFKATFPTIEAHLLVGYRQDKLTSEWQPELEEVVRSFERSHADGIGTQGRRQVVDVEGMRFLRARGIERVHVWTIDQPDDALFYASQGVVAITTNRPAFIRKSLLRKSL